MTGYWPVYLQHVTWLLPNRQQPTRKVARTGKRDKVVRTLTHGSARGRRSLALEHPSRIPDPACFCAQPPGILPSSGAGRRSMGMRAAVWLAALPVVRCRVAAGGGSSLPRLNTMPLPHSDYGVGVNSLVALRRVSGWNE